MTTPSSHHPIGTGTSVGQGLELRVPAASTPGHVRCAQAPSLPGTRCRLIATTALTSCSTSSRGRWRSRSAMPCSLPSWRLRVETRGIEHGFANRGAVPPRVLEITSDDSSSVSPSLRLNSPTRRRFRPSRPHTAYTQRKYQATLIADAKTAG